MFDCYIRVSQLGERTPQQATLEYETACREYAARHGLVIDEVAADVDVSGSVAVSERKLEHLIQKVEAGDSDGIITPYLDRLGRDLIEGALAYKRIKDAGGRLISVQDGQDSSREGDELAFNLRLAIAQDYLNRVRSNYQSAVERKIEQRQHVYRVPFGYRKGEDGRLVIDEQQAKLVRETFERRAAGADAGTLMRFLRDAGAISPYTGKPLTKSGVRTMLTNRSYLGEVRIPNGKRGHPKVIKDYHPPIVTTALFEQANAVKGVYHERTGKLTDQAVLRGLAYCGTCGRRLRINGYTSGGERVATYCCTYPDCEARATMRASKLDGWVLYCVQQAAASKEPHVAAVIEGSSVYTDALASVEEAQRLHDELRDDLDAQRQLGTKNWLAALKVRADHLELARAELRKVRPASKPKAASSLKEHESIEVARFISRIVLKPLGRTGSKVPPAAERVDVYFAGASEPYAPPTGDPEVVEVLKAAAKAQAPQKQPKRPRLEKAARELRSTRARGN